MSVAATQEASQHGPVIDNNTSFWMLTGLWKHIQNTRSKSDSQTEIISVILIDQNQ